MLNKQVASPHRRGNYRTSQPWESLVGQAEPLYTTTLNLLVAQSETVSICRGPLGLRSQTRELRTLPISISFFHSNSSFSVKYLVLSTSREGISFCFLFRQYSIKSQTLVCYRLKFFLQVPLQLFILHVWFVHRLVPGSLLTVLFTSLRIQGWCYCS